MANISAEEKAVRQRINASVIGTHAAEGLTLDAHTSQLLQRFEDGELTGEQLSSALHAHGLATAAGEFDVAQVA